MFSSTSTNLSDHLQLDYPVPEREYRKNARSGSCNAVQSGTNCDRCKGIGLVCTWSSMEELYRNPNKDVLTGPPPHETIFPIPEPKWFSMGTEILPVTEGKGKAVEVNLRDLEEEL